MDEKKPFFILITTLFMDETGSLDSHYSWLCLGKLTGSPGASDI
jgi:hypothetical protein